MFGQVERETTGWLQETSVSWSDDFNHMSLDKALFSSSEVDDTFFDKAHDDKSARDVEDLSMIFEELDGGVVDFPLPCDEDDVETGAEVTGDWIGELDKDVVNVDELSAVFDVLAAQQTLNVENADLEEKSGYVVDSSEYSTSEDYDEDMEESDDDCDEAPHTISVQIIPAAPTWAELAPLDPRSVIRTPVFKNLDSRIPRVDIPRMDLGFGGVRFSVKPVSPVQVTPVLASPKPCKEPANTSEYRHDPVTCWICKSDKTPYKKYALHRYLEKRHRRNWKRGPRYSGRSNVATGRVREGGRFVCTAHWV
jgi:hypothetical protein